MLSLEDRIKAANDAVDSLPEWVRKNMWFQGGEIQAGHEKLHQSSTVEKKK